MRPLFISFCLLAAGLAPAAAQRTAPPASATLTMAPVTLPAGAEAREARLLTKIGPQARAWIRQESKREAASGSVSEGAATGAAQAYGSIQGGLGDGDVAAVAFLVLMEAAKQSDQDLKDIMAGVQQINNQKKALRTQAAAVKDSLADISQEDALKLQAAMDRRNRAVQALSNMMKKSSGTGSDITRNMK